MKHFKLILTNIKVRGYVIDIAPYFYLVEEGSESCFLYILTGLVNEVLLATTEYVTYL